MTTISPSTDTAPVGGKVNLRILLFAAVVLLPVIGAGFILARDAFTPAVQSLPDGYKFVDLRQMSNFPFDQKNGTIDQVPAEYRALDGQKVVLEGEMYNGTSSAGSVKQFDLVYSIAECCFSGAPKIQHFVKSTVQEGETVRFHTKPVRVKGTLHVNVTRESPLSGVTGVYYLDVEDVEPL